MHRRRRRIVVLVAFLLAATTSVSAAGTGSGYGQQPPSATASPTISGTLVSGSTLTATTGSWTGVSIQSYAFQWNRCDLVGNACAAVAGATQTTYKLGSADVGTTMRVSVTATNKNGSATATSLQTAVVAPPPSPTAPPTNSSLPQVTGTAQQGLTLTGSTGTWTGSPTSYGYQWQRCNSTGGTCAAVAGATSSTYALTSTDVGSTMRVLVSATNAGGTATALSAQTPVVASAPVSAPANTALPQITGTAQAGQTLTTSNGTWSGSPTGYAYQWKRCDSAGANCAVITGATAKTFALTSTDVGKTLRVDVTASNTAGSATATSAQTAAVAAASTGDVYSQPVPRYGVSPGYTILNRTSAMQDFELGQLATVGAKAVRLDYWEPAKADVTIGKALAHGLEPELVIGATMHYSSRDTVSDFQTRCSQAATKYHGKVRYYETLNEPNINGWVPSTFVQYQRACYQAIKTVDARNLVLIGGISPSPNGTNAYGTTYSPVSWVQQLYANGIKGTFDLMNLHLYGDPAKQASWSAWCQTFGCGTLVSPTVVQVMAANTDSHPVVTTESGDNALNVGETAQATAVAGALLDTRVQQAYVYDMLNTVNGFGMLVPDSTGTIVDPTGSHWRMRPAYTAYVNNA
jgi:Cellulase (glycosyl hydrolase family 5)/Ig domain of plant-specific actin-binding protein